MTDLSRRRLLVGASSLAGLGLSGCDLLPEGPQRGGAYGVSDWLTFRAQRWLMRHQPLVREFGPEMISAVFPTINTTDRTTRPIAGRRRRGSRTGGCR